MEDDKEQEITVEVDEKAENEVESNGVEPGSSEPEPGGDVIIIK